MRPRQEDCYKSEASLGYIMGSWHLICSVRPNLNKQANPQRVACNYGRGGHVPSAITERVKLSNLKRGTTTALQKLMDVGHELSFTGKKQSKEASEFG